MATFNWRPFLAHYSRELLADRCIRNQASEEAVRSGWMGCDPATPVQLQEVQDRIEVELPDSYKQFLATSNGWHQSGGFIYEVWPCAKVEWFRISNQDWIDAYVEPARGQPPLSVNEHCIYGPGQEAAKFRVEYLQSTLMISDVGDSAVYLLNPEVRTPAGEWEAWFFANWHLGAVRYHSFWDLMQAECRSFVDLRDQNEGRYFPEDGIETLPRKLPGLIKELAEKAQTHRSCQQQRASSGRSFGEAYTDGIIDALEAAEHATKRIATLELSPDGVLIQLTALAGELEREWKANIRPNSCGVDEQDGRAEGNREATGIIRWFLNQPQR